MGSWAFCGNKAKFWRDSRRNKGKFRRIKSYVNFEIHTYMYVQKALSRERERERETEDGGVGKGFKPWQ